MRIDCIKKKRETFLGRPRQIRGQKLIESDVSQDGNRWVDEEPQGCCEQELARFEAEDALGVTGGRLRRAVGEICRRKEGGGLKKQSRCFEKLWTYLSKEAVEKKRAPLW